MAYVVKEYLLPQDKTTEYLILFIALFLIIIIWTGILYESKNYTVKSSGTDGVKALLTCPAGECPTNRYTGEKRCSNNTQISLQYDPIYEVCNPSDSCQAIETPYALLSNGSTSIQGQCDTPGCSCVTFLTTPSYIEVLFNIQNGSLLSNTPFSQPRLSLAQTPNQYVGEGNNVSMKYKDPATQTWSITTTFLSNLSPNPCSDLYKDGDPDVSDDVNLACIHRNPCVVGRMAYLPSGTDAYQNFSATNLDSTVVGCVPNSVENPVVALSNSCAPGPMDTTYHAPVFNPSTGRINCFPVNVNVLP